MGRDEDRKLIEEIPKEKIADFIFLHLRNLWAVDGLYYLGIEETFGIEAATEIDRKVWESLTHFYEVDAWLPRNYVMVNKGVWKGVSEANKHIILGCASLAEYAGKWRSVEYTKFTLNGLSSNGMKVGPAGKKLTDELKEIGKTMTTEWLKASGADGKAIVEYYSR